MKKRTILALTAAAAATASYTAALQVFKFGFNRYEGNMFWKEGTVKNPYSKRINSSMRWTRMQDLKKVRIYSKDRLRLYARILECDSPKGVILLMHGYHSSAIHDFS